MANGLFVFDAGKNALLTGQVDWTTDDMRAVLIDLDAWTPDAVADLALDDVPIGARTATASITGRTVSSGAALADDTTWALVSGPQSEAILIYLHTGTESTSTLLALIDTNIAGAPVTPAGKDIKVRWPSGQVFILE